MTDEVLVPAPSAGDSAVSMTNAITVARFVGGVMEIECEFSTVSGSCNNGVQWSMWNSVTRSSSFRYRYVKKKIKYNNSDINNKNVNRKIFQEN